MATVVKVFPKAPLWPLCPDGALLALVCPVVHRANRSGML